MDSEAIPWLRGGGMKTEANNIEANKKKPATQKPRQNDQNRSHNIIQQQKQKNKVQQVYYYNYQ